MKVIDFLKGKIFYLATIENEKPTQRPFGAIMDFENKLYFVTSSTKDVYKQIIKNPNVSICACGENRQWTRISGIARQDERIVAKQKMLDDNPILIERKRYTSASDKSMVIFYIDNAVIDFH